jgi:Tfp pilus assembly protein PilF
MLGVLHLSSGDHDKAEREFAAVLERDPDNTSARMYLRIVRAQLAGESYTSGSSMPSDH